MRILALITARGGSKRLPGKNIRALGGKPLIVWSIDVARGIPEICDILVSTDDPTIAAVCSEAGAFVPWLRPEWLATDTADSVDVALHALDWYEAEKGAVDGLLLLQPTSPFRTKETVCKGIELFRKNGGAYVICEDCNMVYLNPVFRDEELQKYYEQNNTVQASAHESENDFYTQIYKQGLTSIGKFVNQSSVLDIGCSSGLFLDIARKSEWQTCGIELNKAEYKIAHERGHTVWNCSIESLPPNVKFDVITMWDVFEHIKNGPTFLAAIGQKLNANGVVFLQVPNVASLAARILWDKCNMFDGIEHVSLYSPETIKFLADRTGFEILSMTTVIDELKVTKNYMAYQDPYFGNFVESDDLGFLTHELVHKNLLGYKIQVILRPVSSR